MARLSRVAHARAIMRGTGACSFIRSSFSLFFASFTPVKYLEFDTSRNNLVGANKKYHQNFLSFKKEFPTQDDLVVVVESDTPEKNRQFVERLGAKLEAEPKLVSRRFLQGRLEDARPQGAVVCA